MGQRLLNRLPDMRVGLATNRWFRWTTLAVVLLAVGVLVAGIVFGVAGTARPLKAGKAPAWRAGAVTCPSDPLDSVHDPDRLLLVAPCATVSGKVTRLKIDPVSGELEVFVTVDSAEVPYLRPGNAVGTLVARVNPRTIPTLAAPALHGEAVLYGAWVVDRARNAAELNPTYAVVPVAGSVAPASSQTSVSASTGGPFTLAMSVPASIPSGGAVTIALHAQRQRGQKLVPVSQMHALVELTGPAGRGVRWRAAVTNTQGNAYIRLVVLEPPGRYLVTVFGYKGSQTATAATTVTIA